MKFKIRHCYSDDTSLRHIYKDLYLDEIFATYFEAIKYCNKFSRLKVLIFINGKIEIKKKKREKRNQCFKK